MARQHLTPALLPNGSTAAPGLAFTSDPATGLYRPAAGTLVAVLGGVERLRLTAAAATVTSSQLLTGGGSSVAPGVAFNADPASGLYRPAAGTIAVTAGGSERMRWEAAGSIVSAGQLLLPDGSAAVPAMAFSTELGLGVYRSFTGRIAFAYDGGLSHNFIGSSGAIQMRGGAAGFELQRADGAPEWLVYRSGAGSSALYVRDAVNARMHLAFWAGASPATARTIIESRVTVGGAASPTSTLDVAGPVATPVATKTAAYTLGDADSVVLADAAGGAFALTLPSAAGCAGRRYTLKRLNAGPNAVSVFTTSGQTVDGASALSLAAQYDLLSVVSDGANWAVVERVASASAGAAPVGSLTMWAGSSAAAPAGWLVCDGAALSRTTFAELFAVLGTAFGAGDGTTTFNLPDLRGRAPVGVDPADLRATAATALGSAPGAATVALTQAQLPSHWHGLDVRYSVNTSHSHSGGVGGVAEGANPSTGTATPQTTLALGDGEAHANVQPSLGVHFIIRAYTGDEPPVGT